jgi:hypothetical protein
VTRQRDVAKIIPLPQPVQDLLRLLLAELEGQGPVRGNWLTFGAAPAVYDPLLASAPDPARLGSCHGALFVLAARGAAAHCGQHARRGEPAEPLTSEAHGQPRSAGVGLRPMASTTPRVHTPRDCGTITFAMPIRTQGVLCPVQSLLLTLSPGKKQRMA